jgi:nicotinamidase-related amidase
MQRLHLHDTPWKMSWMERVLPNIVELTSSHPERTIFTRFIPAKRAGEGTGMWRRYYERWSNMTIAALGPEMVDLVPQLSCFVPPARLFDKFAYSPWIGTDLHEHLQNEGVDTVVISGGETDVCVLATVLGSVDWGYRTILVTDAICSSSDESHDDLVNYYEHRFSEQLELASVAVTLDFWR